MVKKIVLSAKKEHVIIKDVIKKLKKNQNIKLILHDPTKEFLDLKDLPNQFGDADLMIVKVGSDCSIDLLHFAKLHNIPTLHDVDTVLMCKNKVALDQAIRKINIQTIWRISYYQNHGRNPYKILTDLKNGLFQNYQLL